MKKIPSFHTEIGELLGTVVVTILFSIIFLNIYVPTSNTAWFALGHSIFFFMSIGFITLSALILAASRALMYRVRLRINITYLRYGLWIFAEILLISIFYVLVTYFLIDPNPEDYWLLSKKALLIVSTVLLVPYTICYIYYTISNKRKTLQLIYYNDTSEDLTEEVNYNHQLIHLSDNNGNVKLSVKLDNLFFIESQDNYIKINYLNNNTLQSYMLRCKLKTIEESFAHSSLCRCHRSFIVNKRKIRVIRKEKEGTFIDMDLDGIAPIPISKSYVESFMQQTKS